MPPPFPLSLAFIIGERHASSKLRVFLGTLRETAAQGGKRKRPRL